jgi:hypothetical protein
MRPTGQVGEVDSEWADATRTALDRAGVGRAVLDRVGPVVPAGYDELNDPETAVVDLAAAGVGKAAVMKATAALKTNAVAYATPSAGANPAALGLLLSVAKATGSNPKAFGGVNLITTLQNSEQK